MRKLSIFAAIGLLFTVVACQQQEKEVKLLTEVDSVSYALGVNVSESMKQQKADSLNPFLLMKGFEVVSKNDTANQLIQNDEALAVLQKYFMKKQLERENQHLKNGQDFLEKNKTADEVISTESGLQYKILKEGDGSIPQATDRVKVNYTGRLINGEVFETTEGRQPAEFTVTGVIPGWTEALKLMKVGSKWTLYIPTDLAYGKRVRPGGKIEPNMALIFDIELLSIEPPQEKKPK